MLKFAILLSLLALAAARKSPHGEEYLSKLSLEQLRTIPEDVLEDSMLDTVSTIYLYGDSYDELNQRPQEADLISKYGYPVETHEVQTDDGYLLTVFRIPGGRGGVPEEGRTPVLLVHGLTGSSADWILNKPEKALAYMLADAGYDVWLGNVRGNYYSRNHVSYDPEGRKFWMFSWNEIGYYDLPAMIDYVLEKNGKAKLHYIGHSQGTTSFFVMGSTRPEYNDKIQSMNALAPVAYMANVTRKMIIALSKYGATVQLLFTLIGRNEFLPKTEFLRDIAHEYCHEESEYLEFCINFFYGENYEHVNVTMIPVYMGHYPAGAASRQFVHYAQLHLSKKFRQYDRGFLGNIAYYGTISPPNYPLRRVTAPVALHYSESDATVNPIDVFRLHKELGNPIGLYNVERFSFNHLDYIIAMDAKEQVYEQVLAVIKSNE